MTMPLITVKTERPAYGGLSIGRWEGRVVMVKGAIPGETVEALIEEEKKDFYLASAVTILDPSPDRIEPQCALFGQCGGCQLHYISYERQVRLKEEVLRDSLRRLAKIETDLAEPLIHNAPWGYRYRGQFKTAGGLVGFYKEKTREVIDIPRCPLMTDAVNESLAKARDIIKREGADNSLFSAMREIHISCGERAVALLKTPGHKNTEVWNKTAASFLDAGFSGVWIEGGDKRIAKYGSSYITLPLGKFHYTVSPMSFFQSHWALNQTVVAFIRDALQPLGGKTVLDLYAGAGNFSLPLAGDAERVIAVEENPYAIEDGKRNLRMNGISNCRFISSTAEQADIKEAVHVLLLDPPRLGLSNKTVEKVLALAPEEIAYVSCNPATLARDLKKLLVKYEIGSVRMIDFFPQTYHIESLVFLKLK